MNDFFPVKIGGIRNVKKRRKPRNFTGFFPLFFQYFFFFRKNLKNSKIGTIKEFCKKSKKKY